MKRIFRNSVVLLIVLTVGGTLLFGFHTGFSVLAGGVLCLLNLRWIVSEAEALLGKPKARPTSSDAYKYVLRVVLIFGILFAIIHFSFLGLWGVLTGFSVFIFAIFIEALLLIIEQVQRNR